MPPDMNRAKRASGHTMRLRSERPGSEMAITMEAEALRALSGRTANVQALIETYGRTVERNLESGRASGFVVKIGRDGRQQITPLYEQPSEAEDEGDLEQALAAARERGRVRVAEILGGPEMLSAEALAERLGVSRVTINEKRKRLELLALEGAKRGFRFPEWQIGADGRAFAALPQLFELLGGSPWSVYRFLAQRHPELGGRSGRDALRAGDTRLVLDAAESLARGALA